MEITLVWEMCTPRDMGDGAGQLAVCVWERLVCAIQLCMILQRYVLEKLSISLVNDVHRYLLAVTCKLMVICGASLQADLGCWMAPSHCTRNS